MNAVRGHKERGWAALFHHGKGLLQLLATPCFEGLECHAHGPRSCLHLVEGRFLVRIRRVPKKGDARHVRHGLFQKLKPFGSQARPKNRQARNVSAWMREARDETAPHRIASAGADDGIVFVACLAARVAGVPQVTMMFTLSRTSPDARSESRSFRP